MVGVWMHQLLPLSIRCSPTPINLQHQLPDKKRKWIEHKDMQPDKYFELIKLTRHLRPKTLKYL